jgi:hypothetical protein
MLKNVNILLKRVGDTSVNIRNRDEVIAAISCYGKLLTSNSQKNVRILLFIFIYDLEFFRYEKIKQTSSLI